MQSILVIDDDPSLRELTRLILHRAGYEVETAIHGLDGLKQLNLRSFDLVVTDMMMPEMEGLGLLLECRRLHPGQRFLAVSGGMGRGVFDALPAAEALGAIESLQKPYKADELLAAVQRCLEAPVPSTD